MVKSTYIDTNIKIPSLYYEDSVAFLFLVTGDLVKENIWKEWFSNLKIKYNIYVHCSFPERIKSPWLKQYLIPYSLKTAWNFHMEAELTLYKYALQNSNNAWFINLSETTVPYISPKNFYTLFDTLKTKSLLVYSKPWWKRKFSNRANLNLFKPSDRFGNNEWCVLCNEDVRTIIYLLDHTQIVNIMMKGPNSDESIFSVCLHIGNKFKNVLNTNTTIIDWIRTTNEGSSPHVFTEWKKKDQDFLKKFVKDNPYSMFLRKVSANFPDSVILKWIK